jgi:hypothetical protein
VIALLIAAFILIIALFLLYLINPGDVFEVRRTLQDRITIKTSIDRDSERIIEILRDQPPEAKPEHIDMLIEKFEDCDKKLRGSDSSFYRFFGLTSRIISVSLSRYFEIPYPFPEEVYECFFDDLKKFTKGIENKDFKTCYECTARFVYLSSVKELPKPLAQAIENYIDTIRNYVAVFPASSAPVLEKGILFGTDPQLYLFGRYLDIVNHYFHQYARLQGFEPKIVEEERAIIKRLFKRFTSSYERKNIPEQYRVVSQLANEPEKIGDAILPKLPSISVDTFKEQAYIGGLGDQTPTDVVMLEEQE